MLLYLRGTIGERLGDHTEFEKQGEIYSGFHNGIRGNLATPISRTHQSRTTTASWTTSTARISPTTTGTPWTTRCTAPTALAPSPPVGTTPWRGFSQRDLGPVAWCHCFHSFRRFPDRIHNKKESAFVACGHLAFEPPPPPRDTDPRPDFPSEMYGTLKIILRKFAPLRTLSFIHSFAPLFKGVQLVKS